MSGRQVYSERIELNDQRRVSAAHGLDRINMDHVDEVISQLHSL